MTSTHAAAAKMIRQHLKALGYTVRVRSRTYAGGTSIDVDVQGDIAPAARKEIEVYVKQFQYGSFDGMTDSYNYDNDRTDLPQVRYAFVNFHLSEECREAARKFIEGIEGIHPSDRDHYVGLALYQEGMFGDAFWKTRQAAKAA